MGMNERLVVDAGYLAFYYGIRDKQWERDSFWYSRAVGTVIADDSRESVRRTYYEYYKSVRRDRKDKNSRYVVEALKLWEENKKSGLYNYVGIDGLEADDILALFGFKGYTIITNDKDLAQLPEEIEIRKFDSVSLRENCYAGLPKSYRDTVQMTPNKYLLTLCLFGDTADSIPRLVPKGKKAIEKHRFIYELSIYDAWRVSWEWYRDDLMRNLWLTILPHPEIFTTPITDYDVFDMVSDNSWYSFVEDEIKNGRTKLDVQH